MKNDDFYLCQCAETTSASYDTFYFGGERRRFGYVCVCHSSEYVCHVSFNSVEDYCDMLGCDVDKYACLQALAVGERVVVDECEFVCMWTKKNK